MNKYKITKAQWINETHKSIRLELIENCDGIEKKTIDHALKDYSSPVNDYLWDLAMEHPELIQECETVLIKSGQKPLPKGKTIIGEVIFDDAQQAESMRMRVKKQLSILDSPEKIKLAEIDDDYAAKRKKLIEQLLDVEKQEGFPYNIEWPEVS